jgi:hypothetical protein
MSNSVCKERPAPHHNKASRSEYVRWIEVMKRKAVEIYEQGQIDPPTPSLIEAPTPLATGNIQQPLHGEVSSSSTCASTTAKHTQLAVNLTSTRASVQAMTGTPLAIDFTTRWTKTSGFWHGGHPNQIRKRGRARTVQPVVKSDSQGQYCPEHMYWIETRERRTSQISLSKQPFRCPWVRSSTTMENYEQDQIKQMALTDVPTKVLTKVPTEKCTTVFTEAPIMAPTDVPTKVLTKVPTEKYTTVFTEAPIMVPTDEVPKAHTKAPTTVLIKAQMLRAPSKSPTDVMNAQEAETSSDFAGAAEQSPPEVLRAHGTAVEAQQHSDVMNAQGAKLSYDLAGAIRREELRERVNHISHEVPHARYEGQQHNDVITARGTRASLNFNGAAMQPSTHPARWATGKKFVSRRSFGGEKRKPKKFVQRHAVGGDRAATKLISRRSFSGEKRKPKKSVQGHAVGRDRAAKRLVSRRTFGGERCRPKKFAPEHAIVGVNIVKPFTKTRSVGGKKRTATRSVQERAVG